MPDNITPETSSIAYMSSLGRPAILPGAEASSRAAQEFPQPEATAKLPDVKMLLGNDPENNASKEANDEAESQNMNRRESLVEELISGAQTPEELFIALRLMEQQREESFIPPDLEERYTPPRELSTMYERAEMLKYTIKEMEDRGWISDYNPKDGTAKLKDRRFAALALKTEIKDKSGRFFQQEAKYFFGRSEQGSADSKERRDLEKAYRRAMVELAARNIMGEHFGLRDNTEIRDSLESLTAILHGGRIPKFRADHLEAIFNMPSVSELVANPENRTLGDQVEEAMFCNLIMLSSGNKQRMLDLIARPGAQHLILKMAKEKGQSFEEWFHENIGYMDKWVDDDKRLLADKGDQKASWRVEAENEWRGKLTQYSNIAAWGGNPGEFGKDKEDKFIGKIIGGLVGSEEAAWVAGVMMRAIGAYASEGYVALPNGESLLPLGEGRFISGDDTGKFWAYMFNMKEGKKGRTSGLKDMVGRIPDLAMNLFDWAQVEVEEPNKDGRIVKVRRSIWDAWLGTAAGRIIPDLDTMRDSGQRTVAEPYHRLGDLNFRSLEREFHNTFTIMQWLMGNGEKPTGVFIEAMNVENFKFEDFSLNSLKKMWKYIDIVMNVIVLTKGSPHLYNTGAITTDEYKTIDITKDGKYLGEKVHTIDTKAVERIKRNYFRNLMAARIRSAAFMMGVLTRTVDIPNPESGGASTIAVPQANIVELNVNEVMRENPRTEAELQMHYIDDLARMKELGISPKEAVGIRNEAFNWLTNSVGRVTGKAVGVAG